MYISRKTFILILSCFLPFSIYAQKGNLFECTVTTELPVVIVNNSDFLHVLDMYISSVNKLSPGQVYHAVIVKYKDKHYLKVQAAEADISIKLLNYGCFTIREDLYIVNRYNPIGLFTITENKKIISTTISYVMSGDSIVKYSPLHDIYPIWYFIYENNQLIFQDKLILK